MHRMEGEHMKWIVRTPYYKVERAIINGEQRIVEEERWLLLFADSLHTKHRQFALIDVHDISYRMTAPDNGMLYLHTKHGVYMYQIKDYPSHLVEAFKHLKMS